jgi:hypothetical protein
MPRPRSKQNQGLPKRWTLHHGAYYYQVPAGQEPAWDGKRKFRLGESLPEAYKVWADRVGRLDKIRNVGQLLEQYALEVIPTKAPSTRTQNTAALKPLIEHFASAPLTGIEPTVVYSYLRKRGKEGAKTGAKREIEVLSHALTKAVEWGYIKAHPFAWQMRIEGDAPRWIPSARREAFGPPRHTFASSGLPAWLAAICCVCGRPWTSPTRAF